MKTLHNYLTISIFGAIASAGAVLMIEAARNRHHTGTCEKLGKTIDEKLVASRKAIDNATARIHRTVERITNRKI